MTIRKKPSSRPSRSQSASHTKTPKAPARWSDWTVELIGFDVAAKFVWILEDIGARSTEAVAGKKRYRKELGGEYLINPDYERIHLTVSQVNDGIGAKLAEARKSRLFLNLG